jgi:hypothetical protein
MPGNAGAAKGPTSGASGEHVAGHWPRRRCRGAARHSIRVRIVCRLRSSFESGQGRVGSYVMGPDEPAASSRSMRALPISVVWRTSRDRSVSHSRGKGISSASQLSYLDLMDNAVALHTTATAHNHGRWSSNSETGDSRNGDAPRGRRAVLVPRTGNWIAQMPRKLH